MKKSVKIYVLYTFADGMCFETADPKKAQKRQKEHGEIVNAEIIEIN